ncbi:hypothetical protein GCM10025795_47500 [Verticiella sediminum]
MPSPPPASGGTEAARLPVEGIMIVGANGAAAAAVLMMVLAAVLAGGLVLWAM